MEGHFFCCIYIYTYIYIHIHHHTSNIIDNGRHIQTYCKYIDASQVFVISQYIDGGKIPKSFGGWLPRGMTWEMQCMFPQPPLKST